MEVLLIGVSCFLVYQLYKFFRFVNSVKLIRAAEKVIGNASLGNVEKYIASAKGPISLSGQKWNRVRNAFMAANNSPYVPFERKVALKKALVLKGARGIENTHIFKTRADKGGISQQVTGAKRTNKKLRGPDVATAKDNLEKAQRIIKVDPEAAMNYCRKFLESLSRAVLKANGIVVSRDDSLYERVLMLQHNGIVSNELCGVMHRIRMVTNNYCHLDEDKADSPLTMSAKQIKDETWQVLDQCNRLLRELAPSA